MNVEMMNYFCIFLLNNYYLTGSSSSSDTRCWWYELYRYRKRNSKFRRKGISFEVASVKLEGSLDKTLKVMPCVMVDLTRKRTLYTVKILTLNLILLEHL